MAKKVNLRQAADILAEQGYEIEWSNGSSLQDFFSYFDHHYHELLETLGREWAHRKDALRYLADDLLKIFGTNLAK